MKINFTLPDNIRNNCLVFLNRYAGMIRYTNKRLIAEPNDLKVAIKNPKGLTMIDKSAIKVLT
jgi:hypothetical protein